MDRMIRLEYRVGFTTPAFLGGADQSAQWRTPPFKALLRHWWRICSAARLGYDHRRMREEEGVLFGNAWLDGKHRKSDVRLRLNPEWADGSLNKWPSGFRSVQTAAGGKGVAADVYLGYGPVTHKEQRSAIAVDQTAMLSVVARQVDDSTVRDALTLAAWFGTLGSRSRNAWGSLDLRPQGSTPEIPPLTAHCPVLREVSRPWEECLDCEWPHAIGTDGDQLPLVWDTEEVDDWRLLIHRLAQIKVAVRSEVKRIKHGSAGGIHFLGYPAGSGWPLKGARTARLASQLRFKVVPGHPGRVRGRIFHVPCAMPQAFLAQLTDANERNWLSELDNQRMTWSKVHDRLREDCGLTQLGASA